MSKSGLTYSRFRIIAQHCPNFPQKISFNLCPKFKTTRHDESSRHNIISGKFMATAILSRAKLCLSEFSSRSHSSCLDNSESKRMQPSIKFSASPPSCTEHIETVTCNYGIQIISIHDSLSACVPSSCQDPFYIDISFGSKRQRNYQHRP